MLRIEDISKKNMEDVFTICSENRTFAPMNGPIQTEARQLKRLWLLDMLKKYGPCIKIAYLDEKPIAQTLFYPEEAAPYYHDTRNDVLQLQCVYNPFPESQRKGIVNSLMKNLLEECKSGLRCIGGKVCNFVVTKPFAHEGDLSLAVLYRKYGFKQGNQEMYLEINGEYMPRTTPEYRPLPEDRDRIIILFNPACEWGYFASCKIKEVIQEIDSDLPVETYNIWENPEEYITRPINRVTSARAIVKNRLINVSLLWTDQKAFRREIEEIL